MNKIIKFVKKVAKAYFKSAALMYPTGSRPC